MPDPVRIPRATRSTILGVWVKIINPKPLATFAGLLRAGRGYERQAVAAARGSELHIITNQNGATSVFVMCFCYRIPTAPLVPLVPGSQPKHASNPVYLMKKCNPPFIYNTAFQAKGSVAVNRGQSTPDLTRGPCSMFCTG